MAIVKLKENMEPFLVNPIGRRVRAKRKRNFYINPKKKRTHRKRRRSGKNPLGESLLLMGNPKKGGARRTMKHRREKAARSHKKHSYRHNPIHKKTHGLKRSRIGVRRHRRYARHRNPIIGGLSAGQIITGMFSALANVGMPIALKAGSPMSKYGIQVATAIGGKFILEKMLKSNSGNTWMIVGLSMVAADVFREYILKKVTLMTSMGPVGIPSGTPVTPTAVPQGATGMSGYIDDLPGNYAMNPFGNMANQLY